MRDDINNKEYKLGELIKIQKGKKPPNINDNDNQGNNIYLTTDSIRKGNHSFIPDNDLSKVISCESSDTLILWDGSRAGDIFYGYNGVVSSTMAKVNSIDKNRLNNKFLYYFLESINNKIKNNTRGTGIQHVVKEHLTNTIIKLPPLEEQERIVKILDSLEDYSEELDGWIKNTKDTYKELSNNLLINNSKDKNKKLGDIFSINYGKGLPEKERVEKGYLLYGSGGEMKLQSPKPLVDGPVIIIGRKGSIGSITYSEEACWPIDTVFYVHGNDKILSRYAYHLLKTLPLNKMNSGGVLPGISRPLLEKVLINLPSPEEQEKIVKILDAAEELAEELAEWKDTTKKLRESMIYELVNK